MLLLIVVGCTPACPEPACAPAPTVQPFSGGEALPTDAAAPVAAALHAQGSVFRVTAIDTGQGDCALVECPNGTNVLIDCGSSRHASASPAHVREVLAARIGDAAIDVLVLTHPDRDHYNWIPEVLEGRDVERLLHAATLDAYDEEDTDDWIEAHVAPNERHAFGVAHHDAPDAPTDLIDCGEVDVHVLAANVPPEGAHASSDSWRSNSASIVLRFGRRGAPRAMAILTGDATWYTERSIRDAYTNAPGFVRADLLRLGHHGTGVTSSKLAWLSAVAPRVAFSSAGHFGGNLRHPRCDVVDRALDHAPLSAVACHTLECGIPPGDAGAAIDTSACRMSDDGHWCAFETEYGLFDTFASGDLTFTFVDGWLEAPGITRGACP